MDFLKEKGITAITPATEDTKLGSVEGYDDAVKCAKMLKDNSDCIDGILVALPNFGDEKAVANTIRLSGLNVPVLVQAFPDNSDKMDIKNRRDSFCGKISVCNNLKQYNIPFSLTSLHTVDTNEQSFADDIDWFVKVCAVIKGLKNLRLGAIGARTNPFNTVRYSEKILENEGISVETIDLSEVFGKIDAMEDNDKNVREKIAEIKEYASNETIPPDAYIKMGKFYAVLDDWVTENDIKALALQCWTSIEQYFGIAPCTVMSLMSNLKIPNACEVDIPGALSMYILQCASDKPSALADWNNNYNDDPDKAVLFHCGNYPKDICESFRVGCHNLLAEAFGKQNAYAANSGRLKSSPFSFLRLSTDDINGMIKSYIGEGTIADVSLETFGNYGVAQVNNLQNLLRFICENGFEHHVAVTLSLEASAIYEALNKYRRWQINYHK